MTTARTLQRRERLVLDLARIIFGGGYDDNISIARTVAKDERIWKARKRRNIRKAKS